MNSYQPTDPVKNNSKIILGVLILSRIIIGVGIRWVFFRENPIEITSVDTPSETEQNAQRRYISERVLLSGELSKRSGFGLSTHVFIDSNGNEFGARSELVSLSEFEGEVQIKGEIVDFDKEIPIILVQDIIKAGNSAEQNEIPEGNPNFWYDQEAGLGIDLSVSQGYEVSQDQDEISIVEATNPTEPLLSIKPFACIPGNALQDCVDLKDKFTRFGNETFTNNQGVTFYNLTETNTRFIFDEPTKGYSLRSSTQNSVASFSDLIQIINAQTINSFAEDNKDEFCRSLESSMDTIQEVKSSLLKRGLLEVVATGASGEGNEVTCTMYVVLGENNTVLLGSYDDSSTDDAYQQEVVGADTDIQDTSGTQEPTQDSPTEPSDNTDQQDTEEDEAQEDNTDTPIDEPQDDSQEDEEEVEDLEPLAVTNASVQEPDSLDGWLQYSSVRGFTMYFSKQGVSYVGEILENETNLGMSDASCIYKVNVIGWNQADNVSTSPDLAVYECIGTQPTPQVAQSLNIQLAGNTTDRFFVTQRYTTNLGDIQVYVE